MATNDRNIRLRVSAQTEGLNELQRVSESLAKLEKSQDEFARSAGTAGRSLQDLENELRDLNRTAGSLNKLANLNDSFFQQREAARASVRELRRAREELAKYKAENDRATVGARKYDAQIRALQKNIDAAERSQAKARSTAGRYADELRRVGLSSAEARRNLEGLITANQRQLQAASANVATFDQRLAREREIRQEVERRAAAEQAAARRIAEADRQRAAAERERQARLDQAVSVFRPVLAQQQSREIADQERAERESAERSKRLEREKTENLKREINKRIEALKRERAAGGGNFGRFTRNVAQIDAQAPAQAAQRLRLLGIEERYQAVLARNPALQLAAVQAGRQVAATDERKATAATRVTAANRKIVESQNGLVAALRATAGQGRTTLSFFQRLRGQVLELAATYGSLLTAVTVAQQAIQTSIERTSIQNRLLFANNNDAQRTAEDLEFVRKTADRLGQSYNNLATLYSRFAAASAAANQPIERTRRIFEQLTEAFTVLGLSQADVEGSFRALEQSISKGSVQAEELRGQLGDRFPGAVSRFAKSIGVSVEELNKLLEAGRVSSAAIEFFAEDIALAAKATLPNATNSLQASLRRLQSSYQDFLATIVNSGFGDALAEVSRELAAFFKSADGQAFARSISDAFGLVITAGKGLIDNFNAIKLAIQFAIGALIGKGLAAALLGTITLFRGLAPVMTLVIGLFRGTAVAATSTAAAARGLTIALGPIAIAIGVLSTFLLEWALRAQDAKRETEELEKELQRLAGATSESRSELAQLNRSRLDSLRNDIKGLSSDLDDARERLAQLKREADEGNRTRSADPFGAALGSLRIFLAGRDVEKAREALAKAEDEERRRAAADAQATDLAVQDALKARVGIFEEGARLQEIAADQANRELLRKNDEFYNQYVRDAEAFANRIQTILDADELTPDELLTPAERSTLEGALAAARGARVDVRGAIRPGSASDDKSGQREAEQREREITRLQEAAQEERERSLRESFQRLAEDEATAAEARVELIKLEYAQKIAEQQKYQQQAADLGETALAAQFTANIAALEGERENVIAIQQRESAVESLRAKYETLNTALEASVRQRDLELERINTERELGLITAQQAEQQAEAITREYQPQILANLQALRDFIEANAGALAKMFNVEEVLLQLDALQVKTETVVTAGQRRAQELKESFAQGASQAFATLGEGIAGALRGFNSFGDAIKGARDAFLNFAADFLVQIGQMILQQAILNALQNSSSFGGVFKFLGNAAAGVAHTGAIVGKGFPTYRNVPAGIFANAPRYHSGGVVGLKSDEVPAILQTGEEVLARNDPRNAMNGGAQGGGNVQIVNAIDAESVVAAGLQGAAGRRIITNIIQANKSAFRQYLAS